jgi:hypothetical protein
VDCADFLFFDSFKSVHFEFIAMTDDDTYIELQPNVSYSLLSPSIFSRRSALGEPTSGPGFEEESRTAQDLLVKVTIPMAEQIKIPVWTDIKILMSIDWTSSKFGSSFESKQTVFQHAMYTIKFAPVDSYMITKLTQNYKFV